jgi:hypothetical protein
VANDDWQADPAGYLGNLLGTQVQITSGLRSLDKNAAVGGVPNSAHLTGQAFDFIPKGMDTKTATAKLAQSGIPFDQIEDGGDHVHISFAPKGRRQVIAAKMANVSDDELLNTIGSSQTAQANVSDDELLNTIGSQNAPASKAGTGGGGGTYTKKAAPTNPGILQSASEGVRQGLQDVISSADPIAQWVDRQIGPVTLGGLLPSAEQAHAYNVAARNQFAQDYGDNTAANVGRIGGQITGSLPLLAAGGELLAPAAGAARAAGAAPLVDFLTGATKGNKLVQLASRATAGALQGGAAAATTSGASDEDVGQQVQQGAEFGGVLNAGIPLAKGLGGKLSNSLFGGAMNPARAALANAAVNKYGIPIRGSQISESPFAKLADSAIGKMPLSGLEAQNAEQRTAFTRAVAKTMGQDADNLTPQVMSNARTELGNTYNAVKARTNVMADDEFVNDLGKVETEAQQVITPQEFAPIKQQMDNILGKVGDDGTISGDAYKALTSKGSPLDKATESSNPNIRFYARKVEDALSDALTRSATPEDQALLKQTNRQWKNMRTVQELASKAGIEGEISPPLLLNAVRKSYKDMAYTGAGDIGELADIGQQFLKESPSSTTAERYLLYDLLKGGTAGVAGALGVTNPEEIPKAAATLSGLLAAGHIGGSILKSNIYRNMALRGAQKSANPGESTLYNLLANSEALRRYGIPGAVIAKNNLLSPPSGQ